MRPCNKCGDPIENRLLYCKDCKGLAPAGTGHEDPQQIGNSTPLRMDLFGFGIEILLRTLFTACPIIVILGLVLAFALPVVIALVVAATVGLIAGLGWTMLHLHFQAGPH